MFVGVIFLVIPVLLLVGLVTGIVLWATSGGGKASQGMSCGACGYSVKGLTQLNCPECGADLREVGIGSGSKPGRRMAGMILTIGCGSLVLLSCGMTGLMFVGFSGSSTTVHAIPSATHGTITITNPDGSIATTYADGSTTLTQPDGSSVTTHPDGSSTAVDADGTTTHFDIDGNEIDSYEIAPPATDP